MVKENIIIPKEKIAQVEEVRELENKQQEPTITENIKEAVVPTVHASDDDAKTATEVTGGSILAGATFTPLAPFAQFMAAGETVVGKGMEELGKVTHNEEMKEGGRVSKEMGEIGGLPSIVKGGKKVLEKAASGGK